MLTVLLVTVTMVPPTMILALWAILPPVKANQLKAEVHLENAPHPDFYSRKLDQREFNPNVQVIIKNVGDVPWTNINVRVNRYYNIYDHAHPIHPGEQRSYLLSRFLFRDVFFDMRHNPVRTVLVYARLPDRSRATYTTQMAE
jgi:hypothetical protein